ncbi:MAG: hypothetical protein ACE37F_05565 [Nannocystaceae bacterium]|nr:hypothetical protein [bacterium]
MSFALVLALLAPPQPALVRPDCGAGLQDIEDARQTLRGLLASERVLRRQHARARSRRERNDVQRLLGPISNQARALEVELDRRERAYIRCVERQLDARARPLAQPQ